MFSMPHSTISRISLSHENNTIVKTFGTQSLSDTNEVHLGKENTITVTEFFLAVKTLNAEKAAG